MPGAVERELELPLLNCTKLRGTTGWLVEEFTVRDRSWSAVAVVAAVTRAMKEELPLLRGMPEMKPLPIEGFSRF